MSGVVLSLPGCLRCAADEIRFVAKVSLINRKVLVLCVWLADTKALPGPTLGPDGNRCGIKGLRYVNAIHNRSGLDGGSLSTLHMLAHYFFSYANSSLPHTTGITPHQKITIGV